MQLHPLNTTGRIRDAYLRYLKTLFPFQDERLRDAFAQALQSPDLLVKGPLVEVSAAFERQFSIKDLVEEKVLHPSFARLCHPDHLPFTRPLYRHQEMAIRKATAGRNIVVATGTGSGKTESFLIPVLDHLLREEATGTLSRPGVRALLLYPMNALANDQLKRLRRLLADYPAISFGRYTGETPYSRSEGEELFRKNFPREPRIANELLSREQMQAEPPHLLLTNYAMLEYLLLRPEDSPFFDGPTAGRWRFIILDEAHVYDGAQAIEMAMLLRRLKDRVAQSEPGRLQAIATSATLGRGRQDYPAVVSFASELFGESFEWSDDDPARQDVVEASRVPLAALGPTWGAGTPELYAALRSAVESGADAAFLAGVLTAHGAPAAVAQQALLAAGQGEGTITRFLHAALKGDETVRELYRRLAEQPRLLREVAAELLASRPEAAAAVVDLVALAVQARPGPEESALLPARYHLFARALEGAFICLNEAAHTPGSDGEAPPRLFLNRHEQCPYCGSRVFELALCSRCGLAYLIGNERPGRELPPGAALDVAGDLAYLVHEAPRTHELEATQTEYFVFEMRLSDQEDEDEFVAASEDMENIDRARVEAYRLCVRCGAIAPGGSPGCRCGASYTRPIMRVHAGRGRTLKRCVCCAVQGSGGILYRFLTGQDAPISVLASTLYQEIPPAHDAEALAFPGQGRKMLIFTDNRQDAAFFAPYLERTHMRTLRRRLILQTLLEDEAGQAGRLRLQDVVRPLLQKAELLELFHQEQGYEERKNLVNSWLTLEIIALDRRISLEGVGLLRFKLVRPRGWRLPEAFPLLKPPWQLSQDEAWDLLAILLDTLRHQAVITYPDGVDPREPEFAPRNRTFFLRGEDASPAEGIFGWMPKRGSNARLDFLGRVLERAAALGPAEQDTIAKQTLHGLWRHLTDSGLWPDHLKVEHQPRLGTVYRLSHKMWELEPTPAGTAGWCLCDRCHNLSTLNVRGVCPTYRCPGTLRPVAETTFLDQENHYRRQYQQMAPVPIAVEEHTAQWSSEAASNVQDRFVRGELNALSCSTTFELGVDVGDLQTVLLRNVPPTTANYIQRAGRAGRRTDAAAFVLTFAQRRSHDLTFYSRPERMIAGKIRPPVMVLTNEKIIRRHLHSVALADFWRWRYQEYGESYRTVSAFFRAAGAEGEDGAQVFRDHLARRPADLRATLERLLPAHLQDELGVSQWAWVEALTKSDGSGVFDKAKDEYTIDVTQLLELEQEAGRKAEYWKAGRFKDIRNNLERRALIGFLAAHNVLPKYGFPVDVVELKTAHLSHIPEAAQVELDRDLRLAISEYAPGGQVVAAKKLWESAGIRLLPGRQLQEFKYAVCAQCQRFYYDQVAVPVACSCGELLNSRNNLHGTFLIPEHGFVAGDKPGTPGDSRPQRTYASRVYFAEFRAPDRSQAVALSLALQPAVSGAGMQLYAGYSRFGWLTVVNAGIGRRGFRLCRACGYSEPALTKSRAKSTHEDPISRRSCRGTFATYHLGHRFMTDVIELKPGGYLASAAPPHLWISLLYGLLEGASEAAGIQRDDIDGTLFWRQWGEPPSLILFDNVPGGAGHVAQVIKHLPETMQAAYERVARCQCGQETSCYECLRNYQNQYFHAELQRGIVATFLREVLGQAGRSG
ncbi:MAG: DEAD/DEAH box helicase [Chloroflexi bacterium]|nr:DEAD/DEAH box helicase [Chloroflexota bacterium]MCI0645569.1 DEAD/DEAH box helicase [Chloroflexota bacterium]MCI0727750.1 DEAD/DEAH box helicase [Chloroflexota bacterium]